MFYCCNKRHLLAVWIVAALVPFIIITQKKIQSLVKTDTKTTQTATAPTSISSLPKTSAQPRTIKVKNSITKKQLGYKHFFGTFRPTKFTITVNGKEIAQDGSDTVRIEDNQLQVRYYYEFMNGKRKGAKLIKFEVDPKVNELDMSFKWKDDWRVIMEGTTPISATEIPLEDTKKATPKK